MKNSRINRRDFLKLSGAATLGLALTPARRLEAARPLPPEDISQLIPVITGRVTTDYLRIFRQPSFESKQSGWLGYDELVPVYKEVEAEPWPGHPNRTWYEIEDGYISSIDVQPIQPSLNPVVSKFPSTGLGYVGEITVPFTDAIWKADRPNLTAYRLYYDGVFWVSGLTRTLDGKLLYELYDERLGVNYFVPAAHVRIVHPEELTPIAPNATNKRIKVDLTIPQRLTAFEGNSEVFSTLVSAGRYRFEADIAAQGGFPTLTPEGRFQIERKKPSRHMGFGEFVSNYELPGVGWVGYTHWRGYAFHSTYWHNDYGYPRSAGCINMRLADARWLYRWSLPVAPYGEELVEGRGTQVEIA